MKKERLSLLYLGNAFPPGLAWVFSPLCITPPVYEIGMTQALSKWMDVSTVSLAPAKLMSHWDGLKDTSSGLENELILWERNPKLWHRWRSWRQLRRYYQERTQRKGAPDIVLVRNLQPVFNHFIKWLRRQPGCPLIVLLLGDSGGLGEEIPAMRRFRYKFKSMGMLDGESVLLYDACLVSGLKAKRYFESRGVPWLWMPCAVNATYEPPALQSDESGPIRFGYFGALSDHSAVVPLVQTFLSAGVAGSMHVCGHGSKAEELAKLAKLHSNFHFDGFLPTQSDCLPWAQKVDVLINVRLPFWGQENSAPSKVFEYAVAGKAILSTRTAGMDEILGEEGIYIETENFEESLREKLREVSAMDRKELQRRAKIIRNRILAKYNWDEQSRGVVEFLTPIVCSNKGAA